jgi:hypothetical protein
MRRKEAQNPRESTPTDPKQTNIGIGTLSVIQRKKTRQFRRKHEEKAHKMFFGANKPQMTHAEMRKIKGGLMDLFKTEVNSIMREFKQRTGDSEDWQTCERACEEPLHLFRSHVLNILKRDEKTMCGFRKVNPIMQTA